MHDIPEKLSPQRDFLIKILICGLIVLTVLAIYWQVRTFDFVNFDDPIYIKNNLIVRQGLTFEGITWAFRMMYAANWHPITWISHMVDVEQFGINPGMHHLVNVAIHALNAMLLFLVLSRMTGAIGRSAIVAALFAVHPIHVESVAWISERKDVLAALFWILTMMGYAWYVRRQTIPRYLVVVLTFSFGLMAKPMVVTLPFVMLLLDYWPFKRLEILPTVGPEDFTCDASLRPAFRQQRVIPLVTEKLPFMAMAFIASSIAFDAQLSGGSVSSLERIHMASRVQNAIVSYATYLWKTIWPIHLAAFYPYPKQFSMVTVFVCLSFLLIVTVLVIIAARRFPYFFTGWFWYLGTLVPVIGIVQVGSQSMADRYTYIPLVGIFLMVVWGAVDLIGRWNNGHVALGVISAMVLALFTWITWEQAGVWSNSETLFNHALKTTNGNYLAHSSLGVAIFERGDVEGAIRHYQESIKIRPDYVNAHCNLGVALAKKKLYDEAIAQYKECLAIKPGYSEALFNMGIAFALTGRTDDAMRCYQEVLRNYPCHAGAHNNLGLLLAGRRRIAEAIFHYKEALKADPEYVVARRNLTNALAEKSKMMNRSLRGQGGEDRPAG